MKVERNGANRDQQGSSLEEQAQREGRREMGHSQTDHFVQPVSVEDHIDRVTSLTTQNVALTIRHNQLARQLIALRQRLETSEVLTNQIQQIENEQRELANAIERLDEEMLRLGRTAAQMVPPKD